MRQGLVEQDIQVAALAGGVAVALQLFDQIDGRVVVDGFADLIQRGGDSPEADTPGVQRFGGIADKQLVTSLAGFDQIGLEQLAQVGEGAIACRLGSCCLLDRGLVLRCVHDDGL